MGLFKDCGCGCDGKKQEKKFLTALMAGLIFFIIACPEMFQLTRRFFGQAIASPTGCPTDVGVALHAVVFFVITWALMNVTRR
jgi:uncharacterized membrane protein